ncbi:hypothetical protein L6164_022077 [Bauhinia variegata]|uniref:Uncharacterized protein n=1 Tax=Bauhinia variegata TaxID=167791 RepID=A0ACB9MFZ3_BAUVA|nr:hypothetical protein L6164_022077 [Bauhinia variegata]
MAQMGGNGISVGEERYAVVTGANKGIGLEIARQLASAGIILDVLDHVSIQSLAIFIREKFGRLDILINNAGATSQVVDEDDEDALKALNIDPEILRQGYYHLVSRITEALLPLLQLSHGKARMVNVSSRRVNSRYQIATLYAISKACLNAYTRVLAKKYPNMLINCVHPGFVDTDLTWHRGTLSAEEGAEVQSCWLSYQKKVLLLLFSFN